jgi:hypothetical protein
MKMACSKGPFQFSFTRTPEKTTRDASPSRGIQMVFMFNPETIPAKMTMVNDLSMNQNLMFSLNLQKKNWTEKRMGDDFLVRGQGVYYNVSFQFLQVSQQNPFSRSWPYNRPWSHLLEIPRSLEETFFPLPLCNGFLIACLSIWTPRACKFC